MIGTRRIAGPRKQKRKSAGMPAGGEIERVRPSDDHSAAKSESCASCHPRVSSVLFTTSSSEGYLPGVIGVVLDDAVQELVVVTPVPSGRLRDRWSASICHRPVRGPRPGSMRASSSSAAPSWRSVPTWIVAAFGFDDGCPCAARHLVTPARHVRSFQIGGADNALRLLRVTPSRISRRDPCHGSPSCARRTGR